MKSEPLYLWFKEINYEETGQVGQKGVGLGEMMGLGLNVPDGFCLTSNAYFQFMKESGIVAKIRLLLGGLVITHSPSVVSCSRNIQELILGSTLPKEMTQEIIKRYSLLGSFFRDAFVAVRSSPINERLRIQSFLNIQGEANLIEAIKNCWASLFHQENLVKRRNILAESMAVLIQKMIQTPVSGLISPLKKKGYQIKTTKKIDGKQKADLEIIAQRIRRHYFFPQKVKFAIDKNKIYVLEIQPMI